MQPRTAFALGDSGPAVRVEINSSGIMSTPLDAGQLPGSRKTC